MSSPSTSSATASRVEKEYHATLRALKILVARAGGEVTISDQELVEADEADFKAWRDEPRN